MRRAVFLSLCLASACSTVQPPAASPPTEPNTAAAASAPVGASLEPALGALLAQRGVAGVVAVLEGDATSARCSDVALCMKRMVPASTFKIPNSIIGLETGVIADAEFVIPWDGITRPMDAWNQDHTLRTAIRDSAVPYYQELARRVGPERMQEWLNRLGFGNRQIGSEIDRFWLDGPLAITPLEQLEFLRRLSEGRLPISERTKRIVLDITSRGEVEGKPLHGKTGWALPDKPGETGWFVGWIEDPGARRYVAVAVIEPPQEVDLFAMRQAIAEDALRLSAPRR
jgi:beta-lactamase class D